MEETATLVMGMGMSLSAQPGSASYCVCDLGQLTEPLDIIFSFSNKYLLITSFIQGKF